MPYSTTQSTLTTNSAQKINPAIASTIPSSVSKTEIPSISPLIKNITINTNQAIAPQSPKTNTTAVETNYDTLTPSTINEEISTTSEANITEYRNLYRSNNQKMKAGYIVAISAICTFVLLTTIYLIFHFKHSKNIYSYASSSIADLKSITLG